MESNLRTKEEISQDYTKHAALLGDRLFRQSLLHAECAALQQKMQELNQEKNNDTPKLQEVKNEVS